MGTAYVTIQGNLTENPSFYRNSPGHELTKFRLATSGRRRTDDTASNGQPVWQDVDRLYIDVSCWGQLANNCAVSLRKGFPVTVTGKLITETWEERPKQAEGETTAPAPVQRSKIILKATQVSFDLSHFQVNSIKTTSVSNTLPGSESMVVQDASELYGDNRTISVEDAVTRAGQLDEREPALVGAGAAAGAGDLSFDDDPAESEAASGGGAPF